MDVAQILKEAFDLDDGDVIVQKVPDEAAVVDYTIRLPRTLIRVRRWPTPKKSGPLWDAPTGDRLVVRFTERRRNQPAKIEETVHGRDELVALLSFQCPDPEPGSAEEIETAVIKWHTPHRAPNTFVAEPGAGVLLRVMKGRNWGHWTWAVIFGGSVYDPDDLHIPASYDTSQGAQQAAEKGYRSLATGSLRPPDPPVIQTGGMTHDPVTVEEDDDLF